MTAQTGSHTEAKESAEGTENGTGITREVGGSIDPLLLPFILDYFRLPLVSVVWNTLEADMRFSMYWPRTWFSDFSFRFSSFTASTLAERS